jgi:alkylhydroperoxidase family enzyme
MSNFKPALYVAPLLLLSACAADEGMFPSLERRPYESDNPLALPEAAPPAPVTLPAALADQVSALNARHRAAQGAFAKALGPVQALASRAAGSAAGSESWVNAHLQLSRLDKVRADSVAVVREFDGLIAGEADGDTDFVPLLADAQKPVADDVAAQNAEIERLSQLIGE